MSESLTARQGIAALALILGTALILGGLVAMVRREWRSRNSGGPSGSNTSPTDRRPSGMAAAAAPDAWRRTESWMESAGGWALLLLVVVAGAWLRIHEIDLKTLTHTEGMLPNLPWPPDSWPPARHSLYDTFWWHFHSEIHPPAHYLLIWGWTKIFGTGLTSLRLPSAIFGIGSILLTYRIGLLTHTRTVGLLAAALVAFNGFHVFNGQYARVYMMGTFLALLSTLCLLQVLGAGGHGRHRWELGYFASSLLAIYTQTFFWLVLAVQMLWVALQPHQPARFLKRILGIQAIVIMVGAAEVAHLLYVRAPTGYSDPALAFVVDYLLFGFALLPDITSLPPRTVSAPLYGFFASISILLVGLGSLTWLRGRRGQVPSDGPPDHATDASGTPRGVELSTKALGVVAMGSALVTLGFIIVALRRNALVAPTIAIPFAALVLPGAYHRLRSALANGTIPRPLHAAVEVLSRPLGLIALLAFIPTLCLFIYAFHASYLHPRALMMFSSYLPVLGAIGFWTLGRSRLVRVPLLFAIIGLHVVSLEHFRQRPSEGRNYRELAELMNEHMQPGDHLFVVPEAYYVTPLFYYLDGLEYRYVTRDYADAIADDASARVWLVHFGSYQWGAFTTVTDEMTSALTGFRLSEEVETLRSRAQLLVRTSG